MSIPANYEEYRCRTSVEGEKFQVRNVIKRNYIAMNGPYTKEGFYILEMFTGEGELFYMFLMPDGERVVTSDLEYRTEYDRILVKK